MRLETRRAPTATRGVLGGERSNNDETQVSMLSALHGWPLTSSASLSQGSPRALTVKTPQLTSLAWHQRTCATHMRCGDVSKEWWGYCWARRVGSVADGQFTRKSEIKFAIDGRQRSIRLHSDTVLP